MEVDVRAEMAAVEKRAQEVEALLLELNIRRQAAYEELMRLKGQLDLLRRLNGQVMDSRVPQEGN